MWVIASAIWLWTISSGGGYLAAAASLQSCPTLCDPIDGSPPGSPVPGILQARTLEWIAVSLSNAWKWKVKVKSLSRVRLPATPCSLPGSSVHGILQARVLEWGATAFSDDKTSYLNSSQFDMWKLYYVLFEKEKRAMEITLWICVVGYSLHSLTYVKYLIKPTNPAVIPI